MDFDTWYTQLIELATHYIVDLYCTDWQKSVQKVYGCMDV